MSETPLYHNLIFNMMTKTIECPDCGDPMGFIKTDGLVDTNNEYVDSITECPGCKYSDPGWSDPSFKWV